MFLELDHYTGYSHHLGESVQQQLSELQNGGNNGNVSGGNGVVVGTAPGPSSGSGASGTGSGAGDENGYVPQGFDTDNDYHSLPDPGHPGYVENSPEFYSSTMMADKSFQQAAFMNKSFSRSKFSHMSKSS
ncbi:unnamed protein product [Allacma fusca]|uniref:Uncharacterized protein n=1 Tax=Allacma fusca TaxID=39272 RepID=A0A8J2NRF4_9HEXA|nr:unnamed protein product [Allacma fusca]